MFWNSNDMKFPLYKSNNSLETVLIKHNYIYNIYSYTDMNIY